MSANQKKILVTSALPYANGPIHIGHLVEYIQTDIWVRFQKIKGKACTYICADDTHGTPIMLSAKKQGISPESLIAKMHTTHQEDFKAFNVKFDHYGSTHNPKNKILSEFIYTQAKKAGYIEEKEIQQLYCSPCGMFLPDRFVKGSCPKCNAKDQYGDSCESCGATYATSDLLDAYCSECNNSPTMKPSLHYFFKLSAFSDKLETWIKESPLTPAIKNKLSEWFKTGLRDWDISRDAPYFGFKIPGTTNKYFYVWLDAPVGYIASTQEWCEKNGFDFESFWKSDETEIHHFIGKDILYFHTLFWPAMLMVAKFNLPSQVHVHGFLTINGEKMSKSRGTFILAETFHRHINPEFLRYYYASKLTGSIDDIDLNLPDFVFKVNADLVNKVVNIGSRLGAIIKKRLNSHLSEPDAEGALLLNSFSGKITAIETAYDTLHFHDAMKEIMNIAEQLNKFINDKAPWDVVKRDPEHARKICTTGLTGLKILAGLLAPVTPILSEKIVSFLGVDLPNWESLTEPLPAHVINPYERLAERIDLVTTEKILAPTQAL